MAHTLTHHHHGRGVMNMTYGNPYRHIVGFALPLFMSQLFQQLYNTADTFIVGRFLGTEALAAVSSSGSLIFLMVSFFDGMAMGAGIVISRYFGAGDNDRVSRAVHTDIAFGLIMGVTLSVIGVLFTPTLLRWLNTDPEVLPNAIEYFRYYFAGAVAIVMYNICRSIMSAVGDSKRPLIYLIFSSILNVALDLLFVAVFHWGVWSAAIATVISQLASAALCFVYLLKKGNVFSVSLKKLRIHRDMLKEIIRFGLPSGVQNSVNALANVVILSQVNTFGKLATASYGTSGKIEGFAFLPVMSFSAALTTYVSQNLGARKYDRAKNGAIFGVLTAVVMAELIGILYYVFSARLIGLFDSNPGVIALGERQAKVLGMFYGLVACTHTLAAVFRGAGKPIVPMMVTLSVWCVLRVLYVAVVMRLFGEIQYIYWAFPITWMISSAVLVIYYFTADWVHGFETDVIKSN